MRSRSLSTLRLSLVTLFTLFQNPGLANEAPAKKKTMAGQPPAKTTPSKIVPFAKLKWEPYAEGSPLMVAPLWGNRSTGAYGMYLKLPAGFEPGMHSHTGAYHGVLISGTWMHWDQGQKFGVELSPGSYVMQPGKAVHNDKCKPGKDCIILLVQNEKGDFVPAPK